MSVTQYLDCGCAIDSTLGRILCPSCSGGPVQCSGCARLRSALREIVGAGNILSGLVKSSIATASDLHEVRAMDSALSRAESALRGDGS